MKTWFTADHHFFHGRVIKYCDRPYENYRKMNEDLILRWNSKVKKEDIVYHLGDFSFGTSQKMLKDLISKLNGRITLILGNHDKNEARRYIEAGIYDVLLFKRLNLGGKNIMMQHYPNFPWTLEEKGIRADLIVHGHTHSKEKLTVELFKDLNESGFKIPPLLERVHVGVDAWNYFPVEDVEIIKIVRMYE